MPDPLLTYYLEIKTVTLMKNTLQNINRLDFVAAKISDMKT